MRWTKNEKEKNQKMRGMGMEMEGNQGMEEVVG